MMEETPPTTAPAINNAITTAVTPHPSTFPSPATPSPAQPERDSRRSAGCSGSLGLTKEVLSAHTQQEEQVFLSRFRDLGQLRMLDPGPPLRGHTTTPKGKMDTSSGDLVSMSVKDDVDENPLFLHAAHPLCVCVCQECTPRRTTQQVVTDGGGAGGPRG